MANSIKVEIVSAEEEVWSGEGVMVFAPAEMGEIGIAPQHAPLLTRLKPGEVRVQLDSGEEQFFYVSGGLLEVQGHMVTVLLPCALEPPAGRQKHRKIVPRPTPTARVPLQA